MASDPEWYYWQLQGIRRKERTEYSQEEYKLKYMEYVNSVLTKVQALSCPPSLVYGAFLPANIAKDALGKRRLLTMNIQQFRLDFWTRWALTSVPIEKWNARTLRFIYKNGWSTQPNSEVITWIGWEISRVCWQTSIYTISGRYSRSVNENNARMTCPELTFLSKIQISERHPDNFLFAFVIIRALFGFRVNFWSLSGVWFRNSIINSRMWQFWRSASCRVHGSTKRKS